MYITPTSLAKKIAASILFFAILWTTGVSAAKISQSSLKNLSGGRIISGITFPQNVSGTVWARYYEESNEYEVEATYLQLPATPLGYFYEGWLVNKDTGDIVSAGVKTKIQNTTQKAVKDKKRKSTSNSGNDIILTWDFRAYNHYVLTLEKDDGNPAPSDYKILSGDYKSTTIRGVIRDELKPSSVATIGKSDAVVIHEKATIDQTERTLESVVTKESIINAQQNLPRVSKIVTAQQRFIEKKIAKFDRIKLEKIKTNMPEIRQRFKGNSATLAIIDDIELVINELLQ